MVATERITVRPSASIRARVVMVSGRKIANSKAFHTQSHLVPAGSGKAEPCKVYQHHPMKIRSKNCRAENRAPSLRSSSSQPPNAAPKAISETGRLVISEYPMRWGARMSM